MAEPAHKSWTIDIGDASESFPCKEGKNLLQAMIDARCTPIKVGCRSGGCGVCRVKITGGSFLSQKMSRSRISEEEEASGIVLACRVTPASDMTLVTMPLRTRGIVS